MHSVTVTIAIYGQHYAYATGMNYTLMLHELLCLGISITVPLW